jgi:hypothetical protein
VPSHSDALVQYLRERAADAVRIGIETGQTTAVLFRGMESPGCPWSVWRHGTRIASSRRDQTKPTATTRAVWRR